MSRPYWSSLLKWASACLTSIAGGIVSGLGPVFFSGGQTFNFASTYNRDLVLTNIVWCAGICFLMYLARSPLPVPGDDEEKKE